MRRWTFMLVGSSLVLFAGLVWADDEADIRALIDEYNHLQASGNIDGQGKLMTEDRVFINGRRRQTDPALNMKIQAANQARNTKQNPGAQVFVTSADPIIKVYGGDAAAASFYWYTSVVLSPEDEDDNPPVSRLIVSLFLVKEGAPGRSPIPTSHRWIRPDKAPKTSESAAAARASHGSLPSDRV